MDLWVGWSIEYGANIKDAQSDFRGSHILPFWDRPTGTRVTQKCSIARNPSIESFKTFIFFFILKQLSLFGALFKEHFAGQNCFLDQFTLFEKVGLWAMLFHILHLAMLLLNCQSANFTTIESVGMIDSDPGAKKSCLHSRTFTQVSNV